MTAPIVIVITNTLQTTWTVPHDWPQFNGTAKIEAIGGGGSGAFGGNALAGATGGAGGGGAAFAREDRLSVLNALKPGDVVPIQVGAGGAAATKGNDGNDGTDSFVKTVGGTTVLLARKGGHGGSGLVGHRGAGVGGDKNLCVGSYAISGQGGGGGPNLLSSLNGMPGGGGSAAGPYAPTGGGGSIGSYSLSGWGAGAGGGVAGRAPFPVGATAGGAGGTGYSSTPGGAGGTSGSVNGHGGVAGSGGGGAWTYTVGAGIGGAGGAGNKWVAAGGIGAGGGAGGSNYAVNASGAAGGLYGGGSGGRASYLGAGLDSGIAAAGGNGVIVITYTPDTATKASAADLFFSPTSGFVDLSILANRRKFITPSAGAVYLGSDGSSPLGAQPPVFLTVTAGGQANSADTFAENNGSGGAFAITSGPLTLSTSSPPGSSGSPGANGLNIVGDYRNGNLYTFNLDEPYDNGVPRRWLRTWRATQDKTRVPRRFDQLRIVMQTGAQDGIGEG